MQFLRMTYFSKVSNNLTEIDGETYEVQKGDTLFAVAFYSGNDYLDIAKYNNIKAPYSIYPGQTLTLIPHAEKNNKNKNENVIEDLSELIF